MRDVHWIRGMLHDLGERQQGPTVVYQDNLGSISWTGTVQGIRKVKHIGVKYYYVRSKVENKTVKVLYKQSLENRADSFTKITYGEMFQTPRGYVGVVDFLLEEH